MRLLITLDDTKTSPPDSGTSPQSIVKKIPFYLKIDQSLISNSSIVYKEKEKGFVDFAVLSFNNLLIHTTNFTNDISSVNENNPLKISSTMLINNKGKFDLNLSLPTMTRKFNAKIEGKLDTISGNSFNDFFAFSDIQIMSGKVNGGEFKVSIIDSKLDGHLLFEYDNLKINFKKNGSGRKEKLKTTIGNFIIKDSNPVKQDKEPEIIKLTGKKSNEDSFVTFIWNIVSDGITATVTKDSIYSKFAKR